MSLCQMHIPFEKCTPKLNEEYDPINIFDSLNFNISRAGSSEVSISGFFIFKKLPNSFLSPSENI